MPLSATDVKTLLVNNINDPRIFAAYDFLDKLHYRQTPLDGISPYRIYDTNSNSYITSMSALLSAINTADIEYGFTFNHKFDPSVAVPIYVLIKSLEVRLHPYCAEDIIFISRFGEEQKKYIRFELRYLNDTDSALPLKIVNFSLV